MSKILFICILMTGFLSGQAQTIKPADVPSAVISVFKYNYPSATNVKWEMEDGMYEASFMNNKVETSVLYSSKGSLAMTETLVDVSSLPAGIMEYITKNIPGGKISEVSKIVDAKGLVSYKAEVNKTDYLFTANGQFLGKKEGVDDEEDDKD